MTLELKNEIEKGNTLIAAIRAEVDGVKAADVLTETKMAKMEADLAIALKSVADLQTAAARPALAGKGAEAVDEYKAAFLAHVRKPGDLSAAQTLEMQAKSINITTPSNGGVAVPRVIADEVASVAFDLSPLRQLARVVTVSTSDYREVLSNSDQGAGWANETGTRSVTAAGTFAAIAPTFGEVYATAEISNHALNDMHFDVQAFLVDALGRKFAAMEGAAFVNGNGTDKPTGLLNGSVISTVKTGAAATLGTNPYDALIDLRYGVKGEYAQNGSWLLSSATLAQLVKVKDSTGNYP
ncbi:phage major capsid protein, partial [Pseudogemmobacter bohemicus]|uniref:phage major capsid protein n=1 Tax=Pseudogemmobacter bohemicus TaxID=2250708 RepID=UPI000DD2E8F6